MGGAGAVEVLYAKEAKEAPDPESLYGRKRSRIYQAVCQPV